MPADQGLIDSVANANTKTVAEAAAHSMALIFQSNAAHFNRMNILAENALQAAIKGLHEVDPTEAVSIAKTLTGNDLAQQIAALMSAISTGQQQSKTAGNTPPVTP